MTTKTTTPAISGVDIAPDDVVDGDGADDVLLDDACGLDEDEDCVLTDDVEEDCCTVVEELCGELAGWRSMKVYQLTSENGPPVMLSK